MEISIQKTTLPEETGAARMPAVTPLPLHMLPTPARPVLLAASPIQLAPVPEVRRRFAPVETPSTHGSLPLLAGEHEDAAITGMTRSLDRRLLGLKMPETGHTSSPLRQPVRGLRLVRFRKQRTA